MSEAGARSGPLSPGRFPGDPLPGDPQADQRWRQANHRRRVLRQGQAETAIAIWAGAMLVVMLLYVLIGPTPYRHEAVLDPLTGGAAEQSPLNRLIWLILGAAAVPLLWFRRMELVDTIRRQAPLLILLAWFAATTLWALDPAIANRRLLLYGINVLACMAICLGLGDSRRLHAVMALACAVVVVIDFVSWIVMPEVSMTDLGLAAIHNHKNTLGAVMLLSAFVCGTYAASRADLRGRLIWWTITALAVVMMVASRSKTSLGVFAMMVAFTPVLVMVLRQRTMTQAGLALSAAAAGLTVVFGWLAFNLVTGADPWAPFRGVTFTQRTDVWVFVWEEFARRPWRGWGFGSFWDIDPALQPSLQSGAWFAQPGAFTNSAHNGFLDIMATTGLIGLGLALLLLSRWIMRALVLTRRAILAGQREMIAATLVLSVFSLMVFGHNFMESSYFTPNSMIGTIVLLLGVEIDRQFSRSPASSASGRVSGRRARRP